MSKISQMRQMSQTGQMCQKCPKCQIGLMGQGMVYVESLGLINDQV